MQERLIEKKVCDWAKKDGWLVRKLSWVGRHGAPDRFFARAGRIVFIEFKQAGKKPTDHQAREIENLRDQGCEVYVCDDVEEGKFLLSSGQNHRDLSFV